MRTYTIQEAAIALGVNEKTLRRWRESGKLQVTRRGNAYAIAENEIARLTALGYGEQGENDQDQAGQLEALEKQVRDQAAHIAALEDRIAALEASRTSIPFQPTATRATRPGPARERPAATDSGDLWSEQELPATVPPGSILVAKFAARHGVNRTTFLGHLKDGIGRGDRREQIEHIALPGRTENENTRYLSPDQQRAVLEVWSRHNVRYTPCLMPTCPACQLESVTEDGAATLEDTV